MLENVAMIKSHLQSQKYFLQLKGNHADLTNWWSKQVVSGSEIKATHLLKSGLRKYFERKEIH